MLVWCLAVLAIVLFFIQSGWLAMFVLDLFFDTSLTTATERARTIIKFVVFGVTIQAAIVILMLVVLFNADQFKS